MVNRSKNCECVTGVYVDHNKCCEISAGFWINTVFQRHIFELCMAKVKSNTVKPVLSGHSKIDKTKILMTNGSLMKIESIAECSLPWSILHYF